MRVPVLAGDRSDAGQELVHQVLSLARTTLDRFGGTVVEQAGGAFTALVGVPIAHEDHAQRGVLCALELLKEVGGARGDPGAAAGIASGEAIVALRGLTVVSVVGSPVDEARMLAEHAEVGVVLVGQATEEATRGYIDSRRVAAPVNALATPAFQVVGRGKRRSRLDRLDRRVTRFVGRERQLTALEELLDEALAGRGQVVGVAAEAGMGKSRLVGEFLRGPGLGVRVREGRCLSYATATPFAPIADLLRAQIGTPATGVDPGGTREALALRLGELGLDVERHLPYLANVLGLGEGYAVLGEQSPEAIRQSTFDALRALMVAEAAEEPTILLFEDLHWIDPVSQDVIARFVEALPGRRLMIICTYRPGFPAPWMGVAYATQLALPALAPAASRRLVDSIVEGADLADELIDAAVARADGNAFFLEELAYALAGGAVGAEGIPATVHDVLLARIDQLAPLPRDLLRTASVLGRQFRRDLLAAIWEGEDDLDSLIEELRQHEFLYEEGGKDRLLLFRHALTHDVAYAGLLASRRRELHRVAGEALERLYAGRLEEAYGSLGYHFSCAQEDPRAVEYLALSAERALQAYSNESAAEALELALAHVEQSDDERLRERGPRLVFRLAFTLYLLGRFADAIDRLEAPVARPPASDPGLCAEHDFWLSYFHAHLGNTEVAQEYAARAIAVAEARGDRLTAGRTLYVLSREDWWLGRYAQGVAHGRRAVAALRESEEWWWWLGHASAWTGLSHFMRGEFEDAVRECRRMYEIGIDRGDPRLQSYSDWNVGWIEATRGNTSVGVHHCLRSLELSPDPLNDSYSTWALGFARREAGELPEAAATLERAIAVLERIGYIRLVGWLKLWLSETYLELGRITEARRDLERGVEVLRPLTYPWAAAVAARARGRIAHAEGDWEGAERHLRMALARFTEIDAAFEAVVTRLILAPVLADAGKVGEALGLVTEARTALPAMDAPVYVDRADDLLARLSAAGEEATDAARRPLPPSRLELRTLSSLFTLASDDAPVEAWEIGGETGRLALAVLVAARAPVHVDRLAGLLASGDAPLAALDVDEIVGLLSRRLGSERIERAGATVRVRVLAGDRWDVADLLKAARDVDARTEPDAVASILSTHGTPPFAEWPDAEWSRSIRDDCGSALQRLRSWLAEVLLAQGRPADAQRHFAGVLVAAPGDEQAHRGLMRCHAAVGDSALALRQYHACRSILRREHGRDPSDQTRALYMELLSSRRSGG